MIQLFQLMQEMSQTRQKAEREVDSVMTPLLVHLMIIDHYGKKDPNYKHHLKEIRNFKWELLYALKKKNTNKMWFSKDHVVLMSKDNIIKAENETERKFNITLKRRYNSILDFTWFSLWDKSEFDTMLAKENIPIER
jgi:hypothetical protein